MPAVNSSWDDQSDDERSRRIARRDQRKFTDATTPTLVDEEDFEDEGEMASLEQDRLGRSDRVFFPKDGPALRRTPGAQMFKSPLDHLGLRRTPGASQMHCLVTSSGIQQQPPSNTTDASGLGFGLTLSTPVASSNRTKDTKGASRAWEASPSSSAESRFQGDRKADEVTQVARPPVAQAASSREQRGAFVAPWTLSKNAHLEGRQGVYSPNTLRLTEDLGNLLLEDDDAVEESERKAGQQFFRKDGLQTSSHDPKDSSEVNESWTDPYVISMDSPSRVPRSGTGRNRKLKTDTARRGRGQDRSSSDSHQMEEAAAKTGEIFSYDEQLKAVRNPDPSFVVGTFGHQFTFGGARRNNPGYGQEDDDDRASPMLLNFGGAFAPPSKGYNTNFQRPVPSAASDANPGPFAGVHAANRQSPFHVNSMGFGAGFHNPFQPPSLGVGAHGQALPQGFGVHGQPPSQGFGGHAQPPSHSFGAHGQLPSQGFGTHEQPSSQGFGTHGQPPSRGFGVRGPQGTKFQPQYPSQDAMFANSTNVPQSPNFNFQPTNVDMYNFHPGSMHAPGPQEFRPPAPQFSHVWPHAMPVHYEGTPIGQANWHGQIGGWSTGEYGYGMPPTSHEDSVIAMTPSPAWPEMEHIAPPEMSSNPFGMLPPSGLQPGPAPSERRARNPARGKNQRKGAVRSGARNPRSEKAQEIEPSSIQAFSGKKASQPATNNKNKKKQPKDKQNPAAPTSTTPQNVKADEDITVATADDPADAKRAELMESPATRSAFKDFYKKFRAEERSSFQDAERFAMQAIADGLVPETVHWRVYLELADLAKRANRFSDARKLYQQVCTLQPYASQGWLEYSKLEEECGNMNTCSKILRAGLGYCEFSENLLSRAIKNEEKSGNLGRARELLARLKHVGIEKVWRTVLEGALLEARAGNDVMARRVLKYLMHHVPWYGPLYLEAYRLERDLGKPAEALAVVERGLAAIPRYGPLWFGAFRLCEAMDHGRSAYHLPQSMAMIDRATFSISKELVWKVHLEAAQMLERASVGHLDVSTAPTLEFLMTICRKRFAMTILTCPPNLRWKVWLASGRMEVAAGKADTARGLFLQAHQVVPDKGRSVALLECARLEEFVGDTELAGAILCKSRTVCGSDWKVWLESVLLEIRGGNHSRAIELAQLALEIHSGTGRLWASLVQLRHYDGGELGQFAALKRALNAVPKSGEVWCEGARIHLNPYSRTFDVDRARRHLVFATKFTPQYGDGFLETLRLEILEQWILPIATTAWEATQGNFPKDREGLAKYVFDIARCLVEICSEDETETKEAGAGENPRFTGVIGEGVAASIRELLDPARVDKLLDVSILQLRCANADPNYGSLWFHCREGPTDTARRVLARALEFVVVELRAHAYIYILAFIRRFAVMKCFERDVMGNSDVNYCEEGTALWEEQVTQTLLEAPNMQELIDTGKAESNDKPGVDLLESTMTGSDFVTGLVVLSKHRPMERLSLSERRKALFGTDALFS
jgi:tetratricopeptide (TPR) repeat protein